MLLFVASSCKPTRVSPSDGQSKRLIKRDVKHGRFGLNFAGGSRPPQNGFYPVQDKPKQPIRNVGYKIKYMFATDAEKRMMSNNRRMNSIKSDASRRKMQNKSMTKRFVKKERQTKRGGGKVRTFDRTPDEFRRNINKKGGPFRRNH